MGRSQRQKRAPLVTADHPVALRAGKRRARACASIGQACPHPRDVSTAVRRLYTLLMEKRGPWFALYTHARHSSATWQLMLGKNLLWVAKQHGHSVEVMLRMYAAWLEGATDGDIQAIKQAMEKRPDARAAFFLDSRSAISAVNTVSNRVTQIVIRPLKPPEFGSSLAVGKSPSDSSLRNDSQIKWRRGWDCSRPGTAARPPLRSGPPRLDRGVQKSLRDFCRTRLVRPHNLHRQIKRA